MKTNFIVLLFILFCSTVAFPQKSGSYIYIRVPEKFEDFKEENQYQLNALTAFLLEKVGYKVFYNNDSEPAGVDPCDVLTATVHDESGLFTSRIYFTLKDCGGKIIFKSKEGESREKDFEKAYHEALRKAFTSVKAPEKRRENQKSIIVDPVVTSEEKAVKKEAPVLLDAKKDTTAKVDGMKFSNGPGLFVLKRVPSGFVLYRDGQEEKVASLMHSSNGDNYIYISKNLQGNAFFDTDKNLIVEYVDPQTELLLTVIYKFQD